MSSKPWGDQGPGVLSERLAFACAQSDPQERLFHLLDCRLVDWYPNALSEALTIFNMRSKF